MVNCLGCGAEFMPAAFTFGGKLIFQQRYCSVCSEPKPETPQNAQEEQWKRICPALYRHTDRALLTGQWVERVLGWQYGSKGMILVGPTGIGKTRAVWLLLKRMHENGRKFIVTDSVTFRSRMADAATSGETEDLICTYRAADILFFDDLGQMKMSDAAAEMLLAVISKRSEDERPCIWTTQYRGREFTTQFDRAHQGEAIRRRLLDFCEIIEAK